MSPHDYLAPGNILRLVTHMLSLINNNQNIKALPGPKGARVPKKDKNQPTCRRPLRSDVSKKDFLTGIHNQLGIKYPLKFHEKRVNL